MKNIILLNVSFEGSGIELKVITFVFISALDLNNL